MTSSVVFFKKKKKNLFLFGHLSVACVRSISQQLPSDSAFPQVNNPGYGLAELLTW
jgi:hypothetical protein